MNSVTLTVILWVKGKTTQQNWRNQRKLKIIWAVAYEMRPSQDKRVMANVAQRIGQQELFKKNLFKTRAWTRSCAWRGQVDATEENPIGFLGKYPEFRKCIEVIRCALDKKNGLRKVLSMFSLQCRLYIQHTMMRLIHSYKIQHQKITKKRRTNIPLVHHYPEVTS